MTKSLHEGPVSITKEKYIKTKGGWHMINLHLLLLEGIQQLGRKKLREIQSCMGGNRDEEGVVMCTAIETCSLKAIICSR